METARCCNGDKENVKRELCSPEEHATSDSSVSLFYAGVKMSKKMGPPKTVKPWIVLLLCLVSLTVLIEQGNGRALPLSHIGEDNHQMKNKATEEEVGMRYQLLTGKPKKSPSTTTLPAEAKPKISVPSKSMATTNPLLEAKPKYSPHSTSVPNPKTRIPG